MSYQGLAFFTGLFSSLHCLAMCGPLVLSLPFPGDVWSALTQKLVYQLGRIITYFLLGIVAGSLGQAFSMFGIQQAVSLLTGGALVISALLYCAGLQKGRAGTGIFSPVVHALGKWLNKPYGGFIAGTIHGLIPCGIVYMALAWSINSGSLLDGGLFMLYFGLGTTPMLLMASLLPLLTKKIKPPRFLVPAIMAVAGLFLIFRGLNVELPYFHAPVKPAQEAAVCQAAGVVTPGNEYLVRRQTLPALMC